MLKLLSLIYMGMIELLPSYLRSSQGLFDTINTSMMINKGASGSPT